MINFIEHVNFENPYLNKKIPLDVGYVNEYEYKVSTNNKILFTSNLKSCIGLVLISKSFVSLFHIVNLENLNSKLQLVLASHNDEDIIDILIVQNGKGGSSLLSELKNRFKRIISDNSIYVAFAPAICVSVLVNSETREILVFDQAALNGIGKNCHRFVY